MKKLLIGLVTVSLFACANDKITGQGEAHGTVNDGMSIGDTNGALNNNGRPLTDSTNNPIENKTRTDIQQRDTFTTPGQ